MQTSVALIAEWIVLVFIAGIGLIVLVKLWTNRIDLGGLLSEPPGVLAPDGQPGAGAAPAVVVPPKASMSRLQLLLFTFVIVGLYLTLSLEAGQMIEIPNQVLGLLGISGASYVISKGIQANK